MKPAFTLVELMVTIVVVVIISVVGFISYSWYIIGARDTTRIADMTKAIDVFQWYALDKRLPLPDDYVTLTMSGTTVAYQWKIGEDVLDILELPEDFRDPLDNSYYSYFLTADQKGFQFLTFMEKRESQLGNYVTSNYASDYSERYPQTFGVPLWIIAEKDTNKPLEDLEWVSDTFALEDIDISNELTSYFSSSEYVENNTGTLVALTEITRAKWKWWRVVDNSYTCNDVNSDGRCSDRAELVSNINPTPWYTPGSISTASNSSSSSSSSSSTSSSTSSSSSTSGGGEE